MIGRVSVAEILNHVRRTSFLLVREGATDEEDKLVLVCGVRGESFNAFWVIDDLTVPM